MADKRKDPSSTSSAHDIMAPRIAMMNALMGGTESLRAMGEAYLPRYEAEGDRNYRMRQDRAVLVNYFRRTIESLVGKPFSSPIVLGEDMPKELKDISENIDRQGNNIDVFARRVFQDALVKGLTHILVEFPNTINESVKTRADEVALNAKPYFVHIPAESILAAYYEMRDGNEFLTHVRIYEESTVREGFSEYTEQFVRILEPGSWKLYKKKNKDWIVEDSGVTTLNYIPLLTFYSDREDFMVARPLLTDLAFVNLAHYQSGSDQRNILTVTRFPLLAASGMTIEESKIDIGPRQLLTCISKDGKFYYVEHTGAAISAGRDDLKDLEEQMSILGIELLKKSGNPTATAKVIDSAENLSMLQALIILFQDKLEEAYQIAGDWLKIKAGSIRINADFGLKIDNSADLIALQAARTSKDISQEAFTSELKRRGTLSEDFDLKEDKKLLKVEKDIAQEDLAFEEKLKKDGILPKPKPTTEG